MQYIKNSLPDQKGLTLIELLVGLSVGLLVIGVASVALLASRGVSGTVSDSSGLQQQAAYAMRVIGQHIRQAGSLYLEMNPPGQENSVVFLKREGNVITTDSDNTSLTTYFSSDGSDLSRNCLGNTPTPNTANTAISNNFALNTATNSLRCEGQPIINQVAEFKIRYLVQKNGATGETNITYTDSPNASDQIQGIEICLVLYGTERIDLPAGTSYAGCDFDNDGKPRAVDITALTGERSNRMHLVFRNVFQLRPQGEL